mgnify:CR=1 FL=1
MNFRKFWKIEYTLTLFAIFAIFILMLPTTIQNARQASLISKWNEKYNRVAYMFSVLNTHANEDIIKSLKNAKTEEERSKLLILLMQPYLRISSNNRPKHYHPKYLNNTRIGKNQTYYFDDFYYAENNTIIGIKDLNSEKADEADFMLMFDINGKIPPNRWGKDIFGINIFNDGHIEPFGKEFDLTDLRIDCSEKGLGINCSYYYIIGGGFDE